MQQKRIIQAKMDAFTIGNLDELEAQVRQKELCLLQLQQEWSALPAGESGAAEKKGLDGLQ